jgi:FkbM family methyltransferase
MKVENILYIYNQLRASSACDLKYSEWLRIRRLQRYVPGRTMLFGHKFNFVDSDTFLGGINEIFGNRQYDFNSKMRSPKIIDCGANIGLSVIFFKNLYPEARVIAFEADPLIAEVGKKNIKEFELSDVEFHNKVVWYEDSEIEFKIEGGYSGRIQLPEDTGKTVKVPAVRLKDFLDSKIDFLKIDIEGAEYEVIKDCAENLSNVDFLFLEYHSHYQHRQTLHEILGILFRSGFRYHIKEAFTSDHPFKNRPLLLGMDMQLNIYAFRL